MASPTSSTSRFPPPSSSPPPRVVRPPSPSVGGRVGAGVGARGEELQDKKEDNLEASKLVCFLSLVCVFF